MIRRWPAGSDENPLAEAITDARGIAIYLDVSGVELCELIGQEHSEKFPAIRIGDEWYVAWRMFRNGFALIG